MTKSFIFLPDVAIADIAFEASGTTLDELFEAAAEAVFETMAETSSIKPQQTKKILVSASTVESLLYDFLSEIIFLKDTETVVFSKVKVRIAEKEKEYVLKAVLTGDAINPQTQKLGNDVKAVTMHMFEVKKDKGAWKARVVIDI